MTTRMWVTGLGVETSIAGFVVPESGVRRIIFRHICGQENSPPQDWLDLASQIGNRCDTGLPQTGEFHYIFSEEEAVVNPRVAATEIMVRRLPAGGLCLVTLTDSFSAAHRPGIRLTREFPQYGLALESGAARVTLEEYYLDYAGEIARIINAALGTVLGVGPRVAEAELAKVLERDASYHQKLDIAIPARAMLLTVKVEYDLNDVGDLAVHLGNHLAQLSTISPAEFRPPRADEVARLPEFAKALHRSFEQYLR